MILRPPRPRDAAEITAIQSEGLATGHASFREMPLDWDSFHDGYPLAVVAEDQGIVVGWSALSATSTRDVYAGVGEVSTYVSARGQGRGLGRALLHRLVTESEAQGWWTLIAQIFPENVASLALHRACGFAPLGVRRGLGRMSYGPMSGTWRDVAFLERRSAVAGQ
ncbi:GNAT family N-acetyltransferase [Jannaschia pohangensis]|uniref:Phosphinothricin acetyltransferase n=1 Tax=Jannaschia pohangensis TaxID=390807 RepID=A0A1I3GK67_9RHOB|nr:GNAT family N-acetyltransferase [Jannaschia pohangensis]SFI23886.1 phosphinothricin acetyltransferase [Jannaschia pohangensis]